MLTKLQPKIRYNQVNKTKFLFHSFIFETQKRDNSNVRGEECVVNISIDNVFLLCCFFFCTVLNLFMYSLLFYGEQGDMYCYILYLCISMS